LSSSQDALWDRLRAAGPLRRRFLRGLAASVTLSELDGASSLSENRETMRGRSVLIATQAQLSAALAMIELDGIAARLVLCPPGRSLAEIRSIALAAEASVLIVDEPTQPYDSANLGTVVQCGPNLRPIDPQRARCQSTEWVLLTSGTTGAPKLVLHSLESLAGDMQSAGALGRDTVWSTFYDIRRYGGLQILLRALLSGGSLVMSDPEESIRDFLERAAAAGVTHITGTPSHWRRVLMSRAAQLIDPSYVRMSGEIADQPILDGLRTAYPSAVIAHAFASTEAGLAFDVTDGLAGFPETVVSRRGDIEIKIEDGSMLIHSSRTATRYLNDDSNALRREDGFVETHDLVELRNGRYYFVGRRGGIINVGGQKCYPEEIESVINQHPMVHMSLVKARKNPLLGSVVVADVVLNPGADLIPSELTRAALATEIMDVCRRTLSAHKVPATIRIVATLEVAPSGKLQRPNA
jgi:acyl-coenzyme A synthetase/AMP-(fatty) acid ligase